jgi:segregation and condensation protein B
MPEHTPDELIAHLTALLYAAEEPLPLDQAARVLEAPPAEVAAAAERLEAQPPPGLAVQRHAEQVQLVTAPGSATVVERFLGAPPPTRLSRAALEALAIIAYRQPVTRGEIDAVRGVNSDSAVATLLGRGLVVEVGRRETVGRPALLGTTAECLAYLGLSSLADLPGLEPARAEPASAAQDPSAAEDANLTQAASVAEGADATEEVSATGSADASVADARPAPPQGAAP